MQCTSRSQLGRIAGAGVALCAFFALVVVDPNVTPHMGDFLEIHDLTRTIALHENPYEPRHYLALSLPQFGPQVYYQPSLLPPTLGLLLLPLALMEPNTALVVWFFGQVLCLCGVILLLGRANGMKLRPVVLFSIACGLLLWDPIGSEFYFKQVTMLQLLLLAGGWVSLKEKRSVLAGILMALAVLVKQFIAPVLIIFALRWNKRALIAAISTVIVAYSVVGIVIGIPALLTYFREVLPFAVEENKESAWNLSLPTLVWRALDGTGSPNPYHNGTVAPPLIVAGQWAPIISTSLAALVVLGLVYALYRQRQLDGVLGILICGSLLVSPITWTNYLVLLMIPASFVIRWLIEHRFPRRETYLFLAAAIILLIPHDVWHELAFALSGSPVRLHGSVTLPFAPAMLTMGPIVGVMLLCFLVSWLGSRTNLAIPNQVLSPDLSASQRSPTLASGGAHGDQ